MINDVKVKMIFGGDSSDRLERLEAFKKENRVVNVIESETMIIVKYSLGQVNFDDVEVVQDGEYPW